MSFDADTRERLDERWSAVLRAKADCDLSLADGRWLDASQAARRLRWAASDLEELLTPAHPPETNVSLASQRNRP
jgi:hypothetical protein